MAVHAPIHLQRALLPGERHLVDAPVAGGAADPFAHVDAVIEVDEFRQIVDARPLHWLARLEALAHRREHRAVRPDLRVAVHARLGRREPRECRSFDGGVTVTAVEALAADVVLMTERDGLDPGGVRLRDVRGAAHDVEQPPQPRHDEHRAEDAHARDRVRAAVEDLRHSPRPPAFLALRF